MEDLEATGYVYVDNLYRMNGIDANLVLLILNAYQDVGGRTTTILKDLRTSVVEVISAGMSMIDFHDAKYSLELHNAERILDLSRQPVMPGYA